MTKQVELLYSSRSNFAPVGGGGIEPEVARILSQSRRNNPRQNIGGVLCYRDGFFFQCLEGDATDVDNVFRKITADPRHRDVKVLSMRPIEQRRFKSWSMKYAPADSAIVEQLLMQNGQLSFNPDKFGNDQLETLVTLLHAATNPVTAGTARPSPTTKKVKRSPMFAFGLFGVTVAATAVSLIALYRTLG